MNDLLKQAAEMAELLETPGQEIAGDFDRRGTKMTERDSLERVIEGFKIASDGCRNLATYFHRDQWDSQADLFDKIRAAAVKLAGGGVASDVEASKKRFGGEALTRNDAYDRVYSGLTQAAGGMLQIAGGHRGDMRWSKLAFMAYSLRDSAGELIRAKKHTILRVN